MRIFRTLRSLKGNIMANAVSSLDGNRLAGLSADLYQQLGHGSKNLDQLALFLQGKNPFEKPAQNGNILTIAPSTIQDMITAGKYDSANKNFAKMFSFNPDMVGEWEFRLVDPGREISSSDAKKLCEKDGFQAGEAEHLLALGVAFPDLQRSNSIIALGSGCQLGGDRHVPVLWVGDGGRELDLSWWDYDWPRDYRFLSVRKVSGT